MCHLCHTRNKNYNVISDILDTRIVQKNCECFTPTQNWADPFLTLMRDLKREN